MDHRTADIGAALKISLSGRLDTAGVDAGEAGFRAAILPAARPTLVDLAAVSFISSLGVRMLLGVAHALRQSGAALVLYAAQPLVAESLARVIGQVIPIVPDEPAALALLQESPPAR